MTPAELRALAEGATPGPWVAEGGGTYDGAGEDHGWYVKPLTIDYEGGIQPQNARLIALAPDLARLCAELGEALEEHQAAVRDRWTNLKNAEPITLREYHNAQRVLAKLSELEVK